MKKRIIAAVVLFSVVLALYFIGFSYILSTCNKADELLKKCDAVYETDSNALKDAEKLEKFWSSRENTLSIFANHARIDDIELAISSLVTYSDSPDNKIYYEYSGTVKTLLHLMREDTIPSMHSIL